MSRVSKIYLAGSTVKLSATFYNYDNQLVNPDFVKLIFYNHKFEIEQEIVIDSNNRISIGKYEYDYTTDFTTGNDRITFEWNADIGGKISIIRDEIHTSFIVR